MPKGILYIEHDELKGPVINTSFFKEVIEIPKEFISKLYMSHAGFESISTMELKFNQYKIISCYTGNKSRKSKTEGILAFILDEEEEIENIEIFLKRYLDYVISNPSKLLLEMILTEKLHKFISICNLFNETEIEGIPNIFIIEGKDKEYRRTLLSLGARKIPRDELIQIYKIAATDEKTDKYPIIELEGALDTRTFIVTKSPKRIEEIKTIFTQMKPYLDAYPFFAVELCALFLTPTLISVEVHDELMINPDWEERTVYKVLRRSEDYNIQFQFITSMLVAEEIEIIPINV